MRNRRRPLRWARTLLRHLNAMLAACVVVMALVLAQTLVACNEERAGRMVAEENVVRLKRAEALRQMEEASWVLRFRNVVKGEEFEWRQRRLREGS